MSHKGFIFVLALLTAAPAWAFQNEPHGFRGLAWGTPVGQAGPGLQLTEKSGAEATYARAADKLSIGAAQLDYIRYIFREGRLSGVFVVTLGGDANKRALLDALAAQFGEAQSADPIFGRYYWLGKFTRIGLHCGMRPNCELFMQSTRDAQAQAAARRAAGKAAGKDF